MKLDEDRQPHHVVVQLTDPLLYRCPMLFMEDVGHGRLRRAEVQNAPRLLPEGRVPLGGRLLGLAGAGPLAGARSDACCRPASFRSSTFRHAPGDEHALRREGGPAGRTIGFWRGTGGRTSERGPDSDQVHFKGIQDAPGRLMVLMTHNTDIADTWEREGENEDYFGLFSPAGYALGVNVVIYAMTH